MQYSFDFEETEQMRIIFALMLTEETIEYKLFRAARMLGGGNAFAASIEEKEQQRKE